MNSKPRNRKSRTKPKKQKFLSLGRLQFPSDETAKTKILSEMRPTGTNSGQINSFSSHLEDRENHDHENVAYFFSAADGGATTLTGLLDTSAAASNSSHDTHNISSSRVEELSLSSASLTYAYGGEDNGSGAALVRNALRNKERDSSDDKWVCYSEVVERKVKEEEVTSSAVDPRPAADDRIRTHRLALKLDYQEIMDAWSDKGPLYIHAESSQIVPDVNDEFLTHEASNNGWGWNAGLWRVPIMVGDIDHYNGDVKMMNKEELKMGQREASVLRYKEKRRNRLFSKKIRYEVRKLNAQKRPRLKGRFVKRS